MTRADRVGAGAAASPIVDGVEHKKIEAEADEGFGATFFPASDSGPHMAKLGSDRYFKRSGSQFLRMEHFEIADMFGRGNGRDFSWLPASSTLTGLERDRRER